MLKFLFSISLFLVFVSTNAQSVTKVAIANSSISGNILDNKSGKSLALSNLHLQNLTELSFIYNLESDKNGGFEFQKLAPGFYKLSISLVGYTKTAIDSIHLYVEHMDISLGDINLNEAAIP